MHCFDFDKAIKCPEIILDGENATIQSENSSIRIETVTRVIPSPTKIRQDPLYSQVRYLFTHFGSYSWFIVLFIV